jgi:hypothetical protein
MRMAWFQNFYECHGCGAKWKGEWSCMVDEECLHCDAKNITPYDANELTFLVVERAHNYVVARSPDTAEHTPDYVEVAEFSTRALADAYVLEAEQ